MLQRAVLHLLLTAALLFRGRLLVCGRSGGSCRSLAVGERGLLLASCSLRCRLHDCRRVVKLGGGSRLLMLLKLLVACGSLRLGRRGGAVLITGLCYGSCVAPGCVLRERGRRLATVRVLALDGCVARVNPIMNSNAALASGVHRVLRETVIHGRGDGEDARVGARREVGDLAAANRLKMLRLAFDVYLCLLRHALAFLAVS